jgi:hypothetical protein
MSSARQNRHIARLLVGAMSIDGSMNKAEQQRVAKSLAQIGMSELIADVGAAIESDAGDFDLYQESKELLESLGSEAAELAPMAFCMVASVISHDRFVSVQEATYLCSLAKRLQLPMPTAQKLFKQTLIENRSRLEIAGGQIDALLNPSLKELLSFEGAQNLVGELPTDSLEELLHRAKETLETFTEISQNDLDRSLVVLGLTRTATLEDAEEVWKETIATLNLPKMANLGETYVTAAIQRITRINDAYRVICQFHEFLEGKKQAEYDAARLEKKIMRSREPSSRDEHAPALESTMTGVGTGLTPGEE